MPMYITEKHPKPYPDYIRSVWDEGKGWMQLGRKMGRKQEREGTQMVGKRGARMRNDMLLHI